MATTIRTNTSERRTIATGVIGGALGAFAALMTTWAVGSAASAESADDYDATAGVHVRADDVSAGLGAGLMLGTGDASHLPTCLPADGGAGSGDGTGNGTGNGSGDATGDGTGNGDGTGDGDGDGTGDGTGDGSGNGSSHGGSLIDLDVWGDTDGVLGATYGRNLLDASVFTSSSNVLGHDRFADGAADVVVGNYPAGHNSLITLDGTVLLDPSK